MLILGAALLLAAAGAAPAPASAKIARLAELTAPGTHGYKVSFEAQGPGTAFFAHSKAEKLMAAKLAAMKSPKPGGVEAQARRGGAIALYDDPFSGGTFSGHGFSGTVANIGSTNVRFREHRRFSVRLPGCDGHLQRRVGAFVGRIHFRGEQGYTKVDAHRAPGSVTVPRHLRCHFHRHGAKRSLNAVELDTHHSRESEVTDFAAFKVGPGAPRRFSKLYLSASRLEVHHNFFVQRFYGLLADRAFFTHSRDLSSAAFDAPPGSLFSGSAKFTAPGSITGPLSVQLPGAPHTKLAGRRFRAKIVSGSLAHP